MSDTRRLLMESHPALYGGPQDTTARPDLVGLAEQNPQAILEVLLDDLIWQVFLLQLVQEAETPSLEQITEIAAQGDVELARQRTQLAFHLEQDRATLTQRLRAAAAARLDED